MQENPSSESQSNYRAFSRQPEEIPIRYAYYENARIRHPAVMHNRCEGGLYLETGDPLAPGSDIFVLFGDGDGDGDGEPPPGETYRAHVMWCRRVERPGGSTYGVGLRFMLNICHQCGQRMTHLQIHRTDGYVILCPDCADKLQSLSDGRIKESIDKYIQGNVV
jgi:hypothetical protein